MRSTTHILLLVFVSLIFHSASSAQGTWTWKFGDLNNPSLVASGLGNFAPANAPGLRYAAAAWVDSTGLLWRYGGGGAGDLWAYDPALNQWAHMKGSLGATPAPVYGVQGVASINTEPGGAQFGHPAWTDQQGRLWMYSLNFSDDMWMYDPATGMWTWVKGSGGGSVVSYGTQGVAAASNSPGLVNETDCKWVDSNNNLWLYRELSGVLWKYEIATNMWTWMKGTPNGGPVYGSLGVAAPANEPGAFQACPAVGTLYTTWITSEDQLWMIVNRPSANVDVEIWRYDIATNEWTCMRIDSAPFGANQTYGQSCVEDPAIFPVARTEMRSRWVDGCGNLWIYGGGNFCNLGNSTYGDLWRYSTQTNNWTWIRGGGGPPVFGTQGIPDPANTPTPSYGAQHWTTEEGFWMMGGGNHNSLPTHHLWLYQGDPIDADFSFVDSCLTVEFTDLSTSGCDGIQSYHWDFGDPGSGQANTDTVASPIHQFSSPGTFTVSLIVENCTWGKDTVSQQVTVNCGLFLTVNSDSICEGECTSLLATPFAGTAPFTYQWSAGISASTAGPHTVCPTSTNTYTVTVTDANGDSSVATSTVTVVPNPSFSLGADTVLCTGTWLLDAGSGWTTVLWSDSSTGQTLSVDSTGTYWVEVGNGLCQQRDSIHIGFGALEPEIMGDSLACAGDSLLLAVTPDGATVLWSNGSMDSMVSVGSAGWIWVEMNENGCVGRDSIHVDFELVLADFSQTDTSGCAPLETQFLNQSSSSFNSTLSYNWAFGDQTTATATNPIHTYPNPGLYSISLFATSPLGCTDSASNLILVFPTPPPPIPIDDTVCIGESAQPAVGPTPGDFLWYLPNTNQQIHQGESLNTGPLAVSQSYWVVQADSNGCLSSPIAVHAVAVPQPDPLVFLSAYELELPYATLDFLLPNADSTWQFLWDFGDGTTSTEATPTHTYEATGEFVVSLTVTDEWGCTAEFVFGPVRVTEAVYLYIPNSFTPNGDGLNDDFFVVSQLVTKLEIDIFDRWGRLIYHAEEVDFRWNGREKGEAVPEGVYTYKLAAESHLGEKMRRVGTITLIR